MLLLRSCVVDSHCDRTYSILRCMYANLYCAPVCNLYLTVLHSVLYCIAVYSFLVKVQMLIQMTTFCLVVDRCSRKYGEERGK